MSRLPPEDRLLVLVVEARDLRQHGDAAAAAGQRGQAVELEPLAGTARANTSMCSMPSHTA
jgi:hypothetical protein